MMDFTAMMKVHSAWNTFRQNHPKFPMFLEAVRRHTITENTIIGITIKLPDGQDISTNVKVTQSDLELFESLKKIVK